MEEYLFRIAKNAIFRYIERQQLFLDYQLNHYKKNINTPDYYEMEEKKLRKSWKYY